MHSSQYKRLAQAADEFGHSIVAMVAMPAREGTYPSAHCILVDDSKPGERAFAVSMGVLPIEPGREAFFCDSVYMLDRKRASQRFADRLAQDHEIIGEVQDNTLLQVLAD